MKKDNQPYTFDVDKHSNDWDKPFSCQIRILTNNGYPY